MKKFKKLKGGIISETRTGTSTMNWRTRWIIFCCCGLILLTLGIFGTVAFGMTLSLKSELKNTRRYCLELTGCKVLPQGGGDPPNCQGDPNGFAFASITNSQDTVCLDILIDDINFPITKLLIFGPLTVDDPETVSAPFVIFGETSPELTPTETGDGQRIEKCVDVDASAVQEIIANPHLFYLTVHNDGAFPNGVALRAQLGNECRE